MPDVTITPSEDGPYMVSGPVVLTAQDGRVIEHPDLMAMCRCGHSSNKPFCDGTVRQGSVEVDRGANSEPKQA
jgi:CDGSH-type Zn-finger protein